MCTPGARARSLSRSWTTWAAARVATGEPTIGCAGSREVLAETLISVDLGHAAGAGERQVVGLAKDVPDQLAPRHESQAWGRPQVADDGADGWVCPGDKPSAIPVPAGRLLRGDQRHVQLFADAKHSVVGVAEEVHPRVGLFTGGSAGLAAMETRKPGAGVGVAPPSCACVSSGLSSRTPTSASSAATTSSAALLPARENRRERMVGTWLLTTFLLIGVIRLPGLACSNWSDEPACTTESHGVEFVTDSSAKLRTAPTVFRNGLLEGFA